jgi:hypothetical protein
MYIVNVRTSSTLCSGPLLAFPGEVSAGFAGTMILIVFGTEWWPTWNDEQREEGHAGWRKAVRRTPDWVDVGSRLGAC